MKLPHTEVVTIGQGFIAEMVIKLLDSDAVPSTYQTDWDRAIDLPIVELKCSYPIEFLKQVSKANELHWRLPDLGPLGEALHADWGHPITAPDPLSTTHRHGAWKVKTDNVNRLAEDMRKSILNAVHRMQCFLAERARRIAQREDTIRKAKEGMELKKEVVSDSDFRPIELT